jgi:hypothetical protein
MDTREIFIAVAAVYALKSQLTQLPKTPYNAHGFDRVARFKPLSFVPLPTFAAAVTDFASLASCHVILDRPPVRLKLTYVTESIA